MQIRKPHKFSLKTVLAVDLGLWLLIAGLAVALNGQASHPVQTPGSTIGTRFAHVAACHKSEVPACRTGTAVHLHRA